MKLELVNNDRVRAIVYQEDTIEQIAEVTGLDVGNLLNLLEDVIEFALNKESEEDE